MSEIEKDPTLIDDYLGEGTAPDSWMDRIKTLRMHQVNAKSGDYSEDVAQQLYFDSIEKLKKLTHDIGLKRAQNEGEAILDYYPEWQSKHFRQLLTQLGEPIDYEKF